jgi:hypothetical protein
MGDGRIHSELCANSRARRSGFHFPVAGSLTITSTWQAVLLAALYGAIHVIEGETVTPMLLARRFTLNPVLVFSLSCFGFGCGASPVRSFRRRFWRQPKSSVIAFVRSPLSATFSRGEGASPARRLDCRPPVENSVAVSIDAARRRAELIQAAGPMALPASVLKIGRRSRASTSSFSARRTSRSSWASWW